MKKVFFLMLAGLGCVYQLEAAEPPQDVSRQTAWGLYVDAREAYEMKTGAAGERVLLIDVRDPIEVMFTGFSDTVDINIPYMLSNREKWNEKSLFLRWKLTRILPMKLKKHWWLATCRRKHRLS